MGGARLVRITVPADSSTTDWRDDGSGDETKLDGKGAGNANFLLGGWSPKGSAPYNGVVRSYAHYPIANTIDETFKDAPNDGWKGVKRLRLAYFSFSTRWVPGPSGTVSYPYNASYFETGSDAKVRVSRLTDDAIYHTNANGLFGNPASPVSNSNWSASDFAGITNNEIADAHYDEFVSPNDKGETRVTATALVGLWMPGTAGGRNLTYFDATTGGYKRCGDPDDHTAVPNHGVAIRAGSEKRTGGDQRWEFYSVHSDVEDRYLPHLVLVVEPFGYKPLTPRLISPTDEVAADYVFEGYLNEDPDDPVVSVELVVNNAYDGAEGSQTIWNPTVPRSFAWPDGKFRIEAPLTPHLTKDTPYSWGAKTRTASGTASDWRRWRDFTIRRERPTVTPQPVGSQVKLLGTRLRASFTTP